MHFTGALANPETWVALAFIIFFLLFGRKLWVALAGMLDRRTEAVKQELAEAARLKQEAQALLADARQRREQAIEEAKKTLEGAQAEAARLAEAAAQDARTAAARRERMAMDRIAAAEKAAVTEVRAAAVEIATSVAERVLRSGFDAAADAPLIDHAIATLPAALSRRAAA